MAIHFWFQCMLLYSVRSSRSFLQNWTSFLRCRAAYVQSSRNIGNFMQSRSFNAIRKSILFFQIAWLQVTFYGPNLAKILVLSSCWSHTERIWKYCIFSMILGKNHEKSGCFPCFERKTTHKRLIFKIFKICWQEP